MQAGAVVKKADIQRAVLEVHPTSYTLRVDIRFRGDGQECWELVFPAFPMKRESVFFKPTGDDEADYDTIQQITLDKTNEYLSDLHRAIQ